MKNNKWIYVITLIIIVSFLSSVYLVWERHTTEEATKNVEILLSSLDLETLANANNKTFLEVLADFKETGATSIILRELSLGDLINSKDIEAQVKKNNLVVKVINEKYLDQIENSIISKEVGRVLQSNGEKVFEIPIKVSGELLNQSGNHVVLDELGIGFDQDQLAAINDSGFYIVPQIRNWKNYSQESINFLSRELEKIDKISILLNNDSIVVGHSGSIDMLLNSINPDREIPIGMVEFFNQVGLSRMIYQNDMNAVRIHSISDKEMLGFSEKKAMDRYLLSVEERNIRGVYLKLFYLDNPMHAYDANIDYVTKVISNLEDGGFLIEKASIIKHEKSNMIFYFLITLGLLASILMIFIKKNTPLFGLFVSGATGLFIAVLFLKSSMLALKTTALLFVLVFPLLAFTLVVEYREKTEKSSIMNAVRDTIIISVITFSGGLMMTALLSFTPFMIKTDQFMGVKIAHLIPLLVIPFILLFWHRNAAKDIIKLLNMAIEYKIAVIAVIGAAAIGYYLLRTGNQGAGLVLGVEERLREGLNTYLGVRPRTKEFLIGYPFLTLLMYLGLNKRTWLLLFPSIIGQISLANTYAHLHTPIAVSLQRSGLGLIIGLAFGVILIISWEILEKLYNKYLMRYL